MKKIFFSFFLCFTLSITWAQKAPQKHIDSLIVISNTLENTREHVDLLNKISNLFYAAESRAAKDSAREYSLRSVDLARKIDYKLGLAEALYDLGQFYIGVGGEPAKAAEVLLESLELFTGLENKTGISKCHMQLGLISYILEYFEDAVENFQRSLDFAEDPTSVYLLGITYTEIDSFPKAKQYFNRAIELYSDLNLNERLAECYLFLGRLYLKTGDLDSAFLYTNKAIGFRRFLHDSMLLTRPYAFISEMYLESGDIDSAIYYAEASYDIEMSKTNRQKDDIGLIQATKVLSQAYELKQNYKRAHYFLKRFNEESNRFTQGSVKQKVADMRSMFEFEQAMNLERIRQQKDKEIADQEIAKEKILRNSFTIGSGLLLLLLFVLLNRFNIKKRAVLKLRELNEVITTEKKRSDELLLNILPVETANELKQKGFADAKQIDHVTVLFTDFKGFTALSERLSPKELVKDLHACFSEFDRICERYGIEKIKTIGDAYMAAGGLPTPNRTHPKDVILAALEMAEVIEEIKAKKIINDKAFFEIRIGVHSGPVVAGIVGVKKFQYDIWGDTVNTASRMESNGEPGKVNISQDAYELLKNDPELTFESRGKIEAKGKGAIEMYFVSKKTNPFHGL